MRSLRFGLAAVIVASGLSAACRSDNRSSSARRSSRSGPGGTSSGSAGAAPWFAGAAPLLLAPGRSPDRSLLALADTTEVEPDRELLDSNAVFVRLDGTRSTGRIAITESAEGCTEAAIDPSPGVAWGVGFIGGSPNPLRADSLHGMSRQDSSALTRAAYRLASIVPSESSGRFTGLPFAIVDLWRIPLPDGAVALVATLRRQINQEDSPLQERTFIVAESDSLEADGFSLAYSERSSGDEETVESRDLLAAVTFPPAAAIELIVAHDFGDETSYSIVERVARHQWITRWSSRRFSC